MTIDHQPKSDSHIFHCDGCNAIWSKEHGGMRIQWYKGGAGTDTTTAGWYCEDCLEDVYEHAGFPPGITIGGADDQITPFLGPVFGA